VSLVTVNVLDQLQCLLVQAEDAAKTKEQQDRLSREQQQRDEVEEQRRRLQAQKDLMAKQQLQRKTASAAAQKAKSAEVTKVS